MSEYPQRFLAQGVPHDVFPVLHDALNRMGYPIAWSGKGMETRTIYQTDERRTPEAGEEPRGEAKAIQIMPADDWWAMFEVREGEEVRQEFTRLLAWVLKEDGQIVGLVRSVQDGGAMYATFLRGFKSYVHRVELSQIKTDQKPEERTK